MAAPMYRFSILLQKIKMNNLLLPRHYSIQPPVWMGGKVRRKFKGKPYEIPNSFADKIAARAELPGPEINIGVDVKYPRPSRSEALATSLQARRDKEKERAARLLQLEIPLEDVKEEWRQEFGPFHLKKIAEHYGIFNDLFNGAIFYPVLDLSVAYEEPGEEDTVLPVYMGNHIPPEKAKQAPAVDFVALEGSLWTLLMVNPDGHLTDNSAEYLHWAIGNIPAGDVAKGELLCSYLQPFPPSGTGYHRHVFLLFKQEGHIDYSQEGVNEPSGPNLSARTFNTCEFYRKYQSHLTPLGLAFYQAEWDPSVKEVYHHILNMKEPAFEFKHPPPYHPPQQMYPHKQPFDRYYDRYRDIKDLAEEALRIKMSRITPFKSHDPGFKYPLVHTIPWKKPSWLDKKEELIARKIEHFKELP